MSAPCTLTMDCGGTGLKAAVLDANAEQLSERVRIRTPYPLPPERLVSTLRTLVEPLPHYDRISAGLPGLIRAGRVLHTPHFVTESGPFTAQRPDLVSAWTGYDVVAALERTFGRPARVVNDAELHGLGAVRGRGFEVVLTFGTGLGYATYDDGRLLPKIELSAHRLHKRETYDERLGDCARRRIGDERWNRRVTRAVERLRPVLYWDHLYIGGGNARYLTADLGSDVTIVSNLVALRGGVRLWDQ